MSNQPTGQVLGATGGGVAAEHPTLITHEVQVGPTPADKRNTIRASILPLACWRCDDIRFDFDSSFVRPEIANELRMLADLREKHSGATISIFGHADPVGDDLYNKQLSGRRATVIYGLLTRDADLWENLYQQEHWDARTIQTMLATVQRPGAAPPIPSDSPVPPPGVEDATGETNSSAKNPPNLTAPYYTGVIDGQVGSQTTAAVKDFQADRGLASDGVVGPNTRRELFLTYMDTICRDQKGQPYSLDKHDDFLARGEDPGGKGDYQGCSEFNPKLIFSQDEEHRFRQYGHRDERNAENALNRRVIALMFRPGTKVDPESWPCPRVKEGIIACKKRFWSNGEHRRSHHLPTERREFETTQDTFACRFYHRLTYLSPCEQIRLATKKYTLRLLNFDLEPAVNAACWITVGGRVYETSTDERGLVIISAPIVATTCHARWRLSCSTSVDHLLVERDEIVLRPSDDQGTSQRLNNLGHRQETTDDQIRSYQFEMGRRVTGQVDDVADEVRMWHDGGSKPIQGSQPQALQENVRDQPTVTMQDGSSSSTTVAPNLRVEKFKRADDAKTVGFNFKKDKSGSIWRMDILRGTHTAMVFVNSGGHKIESNNPDNAVPNDPKVWIDLTPKLSKREIFFYGVRRPKTPGKDKHIALFHLGTKKTGRTVLQVRVCQPKPLTKRALIQFWPPAMALNADYRKRSNRIKHYKLDFNKSVKELEDPVDIIDHAQEIYDKHFPAHLVVNAHGSMRPEDKSAEVRLGRGFGRHNMDLWKKLKGKFLYIWFQNCFIGSDHVFLANVAHNTGAWVSAYTMGTISVKVPDRHIDYFYSPAPLHWYGPEVDLKHPTPKKEWLKRFYRTARFRQDRYLKHALAFNVVPDPSLKYP